MDNILHLGVEPVSTEIPVYNFQGLASQWTMQFFSHQLRSTKIPSREALTRLNNKMDLRPPPTGCTSHSRHISLLYLDTHPECVQKDKQAA